MRFESWIIWLFEERDLNTHIGDVEFKFKVYDYIVESGWIAIYYMINMRLQGPRSILIELLAKGILNFRLVDKFMKYF